MSRWIFAAAGTGFWAVVGTTAYNMPLEWVALSCLLLFAALVTLLDVLAPQVRQSASTHRP